MTSTTRALAGAACLAFAFAASGCPTIGDALPEVPLGPVADLGADPDFATFDADPFAADVLSPDAAVRDAAPRDQAPPPDMARPRDADLRADAAPCTPGERLGLCAVCGEDGEAVEAEDDPECPPLDCGALDVYEQSFEDGVLICTVDRRAPRGGICRSIGECHDDLEVYCGAPRPIEVDYIVPGACISMDGCEGPEPPVVSVRPEGRRCHNVGTCDGEGSCSANPDCAEFEPGGQSLFCAARDGEGAFCEFYLQTGMDISCRSFCADYGWDCVDAWNTMVGVCEHPEAGMGCDTTFGSFVCRCEP